MNKPVIFSLGLIAGLLIAGTTKISFAPADNRGRLQDPTKFENANLPEVPFDGRWLVSWGGENKEINHHYGASAQALALDIRKIWAGSDQTMIGDPKKNESYGCWAQPILSPIDGVVVESVDGVPDNIPGEMNRGMSFGNYVKVRSDDGFVVVMCHFKQDSVTVQSGQRVKVGDLVALCGNSGRSTEPHLHFHVQSEIKQDASVALRTVFQEITVGGTSRKHYTPIKGDIISKSTSPSN